MVVGAVKTGGGKVDRRRILWIDRERGDDEAVAPGEVGGEALPRSTAVIGAVGTAFGDDVNGEWIRRIDGEPLDVAVRQKCEGLPRLASVQRTIELPINRLRQRIDHARRRWRDGHAHHGGTSQPSVRTAAGEVHPRSSCGGRGGEYG